MKPLLPWAATLVVLSCHPTRFEAHKSQLGATQQDDERDCVVRRAAYDIGSATTKVKVAEVDHCKGEILSMLFAAHAPVFYRDDVNSPTPAFTSETMARGMMVLKSFANEAKKRGATDSAGVATSAFRRAENAAVMVQRIERELGIRISIVTQAHEARLGFTGVIMRTGRDPDRTVVWDVGGRSMQLTAMRADGSMQIYEGNLASGPMRDYIIRDVQGQPPAVETPNPITQQQATTALGYVESHASRHVPPGLRTKVADEHVEVVGIGALKYYGDQLAQVPGSVCTASQLSVGISNLTDKNDAEIGGSYASTAVSDRILLLGFMRVLAIDTVRLVDMELSDGILVDSGLWSASLRLSAHGDQD